MGLTVKKHKINLISAIKHKVNIKFKSNSKN